MDKLDEKATRWQDADPTASSRKQDHIELAFQSQVDAGSLDQRFDYEPLLAGHPNPGSYPSTLFLGKTFKAPLWVSSMTGGTEMARTINHNLARACKDFGMGMGLGSCRVLLESDDRLADFNVRPLLGSDQPLYANLGVAQIEQLLDRGEYYRIDRLITKLDADGLIIHVNPLQEWLQPEGDHFKKPPLQIIETVLEKADYPIIVKEVGQGFGPASMRALLQLPLAAIDFAANGGTNFAKLELFRSEPLQQELYGKLANVGHSAEAMTAILNQQVEVLGDAIRCKEVIISGGIRNFLDGFYLIHKARLNAVYGQASQFLKHARADYDTLAQYVESQIRGLELANALLRLR
ncbi:MAG: isopentenyl-diphosphate delta-isomerase [Phaeodactylibacter sp.]|nr:isopentenyl-diphosphate delta-isomerase [Phaeodactylibacter sp.]